MDCIVFRQTTCPGSSSSTLGSFAVFSKRASDDIFSPGAMLPPRYSDFSLTAQNVVAVPKSIMTRGPPYFANAATAFTILSAPTCLGLSYLIINPVLTPGSMTMALFLKYFTARCCIVKSTDGTTVDTITSSTSFMFRFSYEKSWLIIIPYSSALLLLSLSSRQFWMSSPSLNTPRTILVFPTSNASSMDIPPLLCFVQ